MMGKGICGRIIIPDSSGLLSGTFTEGSYLKLLLTNRLGCRSPICPTRLQVTLSSQVSCTPDCSIPRATQALWSCYISMLLRSELLSSSVAAELILWQAIGTCHNRRDICDLPSSRVSYSVWKPYSNFTPCTRAWCFSCTLSIFAVSGERRDWLSG